MPVMAHILQNPGKSHIVLRMPQRMRNRRLIPCDQEKLMGFLADLQTISPESIINLSTFDLIDQTCSLVYY